MRDDLEVRPVASDRDLAAFIRVAWTVNAGDPNWVPPLVAERRKLLDAARNPFFRDNPHRFLVARRGGGPVGRIAATLNNSCADAADDPTGFIGFLDAVDDRRVFAALLGEAEDWLRERGCRHVIGPVNPDMNHDVGVLVDGFDTRPFVMLSHNPPYYDAHMHAAGYDKARDFHCYRVSREEYVGNGKLRRVRDAVLRRHPVTLRAGDLRRFDEDLAIIRRVYNDAFAGHWGFVPLGDDDVRFMAADLKQLLDPELVVFAEAAGEPVAFLLALPNINEVLIRVPNGRLFPFGWLRLLRGLGTVRSARVLTIAVTRRCQHWGLGSVLYDEAARRLVARGYTHAEMSWVMEDNLRMRRAALLLGGRPCRTYRVYTRRIT